MAQPEERLDMSYRPTEFISEAQVAESPVKRSKAEELLQKIYSTNVPEPVFDQAKADRLKRMGRVNQMGKGISVLGDMLASGLGANVKRRQDDGTAARLYQSYENNLDKYKNDQDIYSLRKMSKSLDDAKIGLSEARREEQLDFQNRKQADWMKAKEADNKLNWAKWSAEYDRKLKADEVDAEYKKMNAESNRIRANRTGLKEPKPEKPFMVIGQNGQERPIAQGEFRALLEEAQNTPGWSKEDFKTMMAPYENTPLEGQKNIVQRFSTWKAKQEALKQINSPEFKAGEKEALDRVRKERGLSTDPVSSEISQQKAKPTVDYSKLVY